MTSAAPRPSLSRPGEALGHGRWLLPTQFGARIPLVSRSDRLGRDSLGVHMAAVVLGGVLFLLFRHEIRPVGPQIHFLTQNLARSDEHTPELQSRPHLVCRLLLATNKML